MSGIGRDDIRTGQLYEEARADSRRAIAELKRHRRVALGELLSIVFENRDTIRSMVEEVVRAERLTDPSLVAAEVDAFNEVVPLAGELGATLYVEIADPAELATRLEEFEGVEQCTYVEVRGVRTVGVPHPVALADEAPSAFYIGFPVSSAQRAAWLAGEPVYVGVEHASARARVELDSRHREALAADLVTH